MISTNKCSMGLFNDSVKYADNIKTKERVILKKLNLKEIKVVDFPINQYIRRQTNKKQIVLHHTVSGLGVNGDISWWRKTKARVGTAIIIGWDGKIYQCFSSKYWAYHLGTKTSNSKALNEGSIGIEIDAWGGLVELKGKWYPAKWDTSLRKMVANTKVKPIKNVVEYPNKFRGFYGYEKYTDAQIESVRQLLVFWGEKYKIPLKYNHDMFRLSQDALSGKAGVWSHTSFRKDKSDIHPQKELVEMLKSLT